MPSLREQILAGQAPKGFVSSRLGGIIGEQSPYRVNMWLTDVEGKMLIHTNGQITRTGGSRADARVFLWGPGVSIFLLDPDMNPDLTKVWEVDEDSGETFRTSWEVKVPFLPEQKPEGVEPDGEEADGTPYKLVRKTAAILVAVSTKDPLPDLLARKGMVLGSLNLIKAGETLTNGGKATVDMYQGDIALVHRGAFTGEILAKASILYTDPTKVKERENQSLCWFSLPQATYQACLARQYPWLAKKGGYTTKLADEPATAGGEDKKHEDDIPF